jgi:hypothetical protein
MNNVSRETDFYPYWSAWKIFDGVKNARSAADKTAFHRAVSLMPTALKEAERDPRRALEHRAKAIGIPVSYAADVYRNLEGGYPLADREAMAFAAVHRDFGSLKILDRLCGKYGFEEDEPCSGAYLTIVAKVRQMVAEHDSIALSEVRRVFSKEDRVRLRSIWREMERNKDFSVERRGNTDITLHRRVPESTKLVLPEPFRKGQKFFEPETLDLTPVSAQLNAPSPSLANGADFDNHPWESWEEAQTLESYLEPAERHTRNHEAFSIDECQWLADQPGKRANGMAYRPIEIRDINGHITAKIEIDGEGQLESDYGGGCMALCDWKNLWIRLFSPAGEPSASFSLLRSPELRRILAERGDRGMPPKAALRSWSASLNDGLLAIAVIDSVFVYGFDGSVHGGIRLPKIVEEYQISDSRFSASTSHDDWVYFVQLARDGLSVFVGGYSGRLLQLTLDGRILNAWNVGHAPQKLRETARGLAGWNGSYFFRIDSRQGVEFSTPFVGAFPESIGPFIMLGKRNDFGIFHLETFTGRRVRLPKAKTALYVRGQELIAETATKAFVIS